MSDLDKSRRLYLDDPPTLDADHVKYNILPTSKFSYYCLPLEQGNGSLPTNLLGENQWIIDWVRKLALARQINPNPASAFCMTSH